MVSKTRRWVDLLLLILVVIAGIFAYKNAVTIGDWWHGLRYNPVPAITKLASDAGMNSYGQRLFYRFSPQFVNSQELISQCGTEKLGCAKNRNIYILEFSDAVKYNRAIVTASHEMLHIAYSRLSQTQKAKVEIMLKNQLDEVYDSAVNQQLDVIDEDDYINEAHSYIGSQTTKLTQELEDYYRQYFDNRAKTIEAFKLSPES